VSLPSVYIGSSIWRSIEPTHLKALVPFLRDNHYGYYPQVGDAMIERARGMSASYFLRHTKGDVHLSIDSDIVDFQKAAIDMMCEQAVTHDIVGAVYICRATARTFPATFFEEEKPIMFARDPTPVPVKWVATGCVAVHRRVFEKMAETMPLLHEEDGDRAFYDFYETMQLEDKDHGRIKLSEDFAFSERAKALGFTSYINPAVRVGHMGVYVHRLEDMAAKTLQPQPISIERSGRYWRVKCEGLEETDESMGRIPKGEGDEIRARFDKSEESRAERRRRERNDKKVVAHSSY